MESSIKIILEKLKKLNRSSRAEEYPELLKSHIINTKRLVRHRNPKGYHNTIRIRVSSELLEYIKQKTNYSGYIRNLIINDIKTLEAMKCQS